MHDQLLLLALFSLALTNEPMQTGSLPITSTKCEHNTKLHQCISKVINLETLKSGHFLLHDQILPNINFNQSSYPI